MLRLLALDSEFLIKFRKEEDDLEDSCEICGSDLKTIMEDDGFKNLIERKVCTSRYCINNEFGDESEDDENMDEEIDEEDVEEDIDEDEELLPKLEKLDL